MAPGGDQRQLGAAEMTYTWPLAASLRRFKLSNEPHVAAKLKEIVGLFVNPPDHSIVLRSMRKAKSQPFSPGAQRCHSGFLDDINTSPKAFTWTKNPNTIITAVKRGTKR